MNKSPITSPTPPHFDKLSVNMREDEIAQFKKRED